MQPDIARLLLNNDEPGTNGDVGPPVEPPQYTKYARSRDITKEFNQASAGLRLGQLIKDEYFTLFESVGALEIMDPKMDSGFMMPEKDAIVDNFDPLKPMLPEEIIGIMDQMLCYEMAWHDGYPLSQTLFTSLHLTSITPQEYKPLERVVFESKQTNVPNPLVSKVLRAYCLGLLKSCDYVITDIVSQHYYEEEDFVTNTFTQYLLTDIDDSAITGVLDTAIQSLETMELSVDIMSALAARLELRSLMLKAFQPLSAVYHAGKTKLWQDVLTATKMVNETASLGKAVPDVFSERVQRHLASNTPPRPMIDIAWKEAFSKLQRLCDDVIEAYRMATIEQPSPYNITRFTNDFSSRSPHPSTYARAILQGILFKENKHASSIPHATLLLSSIRELALAGDPIISPQNWDMELPSSPRHATARKIDAFILKALEEFLNIPRMLSQNRCRVRRTLSQSISILDQLQAEAEIIDAEIHGLVTDVLATVGPSAVVTAKTPSSDALRFATSCEDLQYFPLAAWTYFQKLQVAEWTVLLGFETEVYLPDEMASMYAFLAFLAETREEHLGHMDFFAQRRVQRLSRVGDRGAMKEALESRKFIAVEVARARVVRGLGEALTGLYALLTTLYLLPTSTPQTTTFPSPSETHTYSTPPLRYEARLKPFLQIGTPILPSSTDLQNLSTFPSPIFPTSTRLSSIFSTIDSSLKNAKNELNGVLKTAEPRTGKFVGCEGAWKAEVRGGLGSVVGLGVAVAGLRECCRGVRVERVGDVCVAGDGESADGEKAAKARDLLEQVRQKIRVVIPEPEKRWAGGWAVPKIVEIK